MHADITKKDMMLKQAQDHARTANSKGLNPMNRYMGQARSDSFSSDDDEDDSSFSQDGELNYFGGDPTSLHDQSPPKDDKIEDNQ